jgi:hypothetical protein
MNRLVKKYMPNFKPNWRELISELKQQNDYMDEDDGANADPAHSKSVIYTLKELKKHYNTEKEKVKNKNKNVILN